MIKISHHPDPRSPKSKRKTDFKKGLQKKKIQTPENIKSSCPLAIAMTQFPWSSSGRILCLNHLGTVPNAVLVRYRGSPTSP